MVGRWSWQNPRKFGTKNLNSSAMNMPLPVGVPQQGRPANIAWCVSQADLSAIVYPSQAVAAISAKRPLSARGAMTVAAVAPALAE